MYVHVNEKHSTYDLKFTQLNFSNSSFQRVTKRNFQWRKPHTRENLSETCRLVNKYPERETDEI